MNKISLLNQANFWLWWNNTIYHVDLHDNKGECVCFAEERGVSSC